MLHPLLASVDEILQRAVAEVPAFANISLPHPVSSAEGVLTCLRQFPVLTKDELRADIRQFLSSAFDPAKLREAHTSGSSGFPLTILRDVSELELERAFVARGFAPIGLNYGDRTVVLRARRTPRASNGTTYVGRDGTVWISVMDFRPDTLDRVATELLEFDTHLIRGYGSVVGPVLAHLAERGITLEALKGVAYSSDEMNPAERVFIREHLGLKLISLYGQTERAVMATSAPFSDLMTPIEGYGFVELIRADGTLITAPGEVGEIVGTSLFPRATAIIRYRTGDLASWADFDEHTGTGRLDGIVGRTAVLLIDRDGEQIAYSRDFKNAVLSPLPPNVRVQFVQNEPGKLTLRFDCNQSKDLAQSIEAFELFRDSFDLSVEWNAEILPSASGKRQLFVKLD